MTNFSEECRHLTKGTTIAFLAELADIGNILALSDGHADDLPNEDAAPNMYINKALSQNRRTKIRRVLHSYCECLSSSSSFNGPQTPIAKHRVVTGAHCDLYDKVPTVCRNEKVKPSDRRSTRCFTTMSFSLRNALAQYRSFLSQRNMKAYASAWIKAD